MYSEANINAVEKGFVMNRIQKISWLMVVTIVIAIIASVVAVGLLYSKFGFPKARAGLAFMAIAGFGGLGPMIFKKDPGHVQADERDILINLKAARAGFAISYLVFGLLCMGIWHCYRVKAIETISIDILPELFGAAAITAFLTHAITILVLYGRDAKLPDLDGEKS